MGKVSRSEIIRIFILIVGYPIGGRSWLWNAYCMTMVLTLTGAYAWVRFIQKCFTASTTVTTYDSFKAITAFSSPAVMAIMATNVYHLFRLLMRHKVFSRIFRDGKVLGVFGCLDVVVMSLSTFIFVPNLFRTSKTLIEKARLVLFGPVVNLNFFIAFQFCAVLKFHRRRISRLTERLRVGVENSNNPLKLACWCIQSHRTVVSEVFKALDEFDKQLLVVIFHLVVDMIQFPAYSIGRYLQTGLPETLICLYLYMGLTRWVVLFYINAHFHGIQKQDEHFTRKLYDLTKTNSELYHDQRLILYLKLKKPLILTACGFFTYGYPLVISIMGAVTSYLVVLLQFSV